MARGEDLWRETKIYGERGIETGKHTAMLNIRENEWQRSRETKKVWEIETVWWRDKDRELLSVRWKEEIAYSESRINIIESSQKHFESEGMSNV